MRAMLSLRNHAVERVALHRDATGAPNERHQLPAGEFLRRFCAGHVINPLFADSAIEVIDPKSEGQLRELNPQHGPVRLDVREVVEHQSGLIGQAS